MPDNQYQPRFLEELREVVARVPAVRVLSAKLHGDGNWCSKPVLDRDHPLDWNVVQEFGYVLNELSVFERLTTVFKPVSPPPYLNGGPREYLAWVVETAAPTPPRFVLKTLEGRLPKPVEDISQWPEK